MLEYYMPEYDAEIGGFKIYKGLNQGLLEIRRGDKKWDIKNAWGFPIVKFLDDKLIVVVRANCIYIIRDDDLKSYTGSTAEINGKYYVCKGGHVYDVLEQKKCESNIKLDSEIYLSEYGMLHSCNGMGNITGSNLHYMFDDDDYICVSYYISHREATFVRYYIIDKKTGTPTYEFLIPYIISRGLNEYQVVHPSGKRFNLQHKTLDNGSSSTWHNDFLYLRSNQVRIYGDYKLDYLKYLSSENKYIILRCLWLFSRKSKHLQPSLLSYYVPKVLVLNIVLKYVL